MLRTFRRGDYFWSIGRQGTTATVRHGKAGGKVKERRLTIAATEKDRERYRRMLDDRAEAGFIEEVPEPPAIDATGRALEAALVEEPDELANHMAYADWLSEQADPRLSERGEFIRVQLALEEKGLPAGRSLRNREGKLFAAREHEWLGHELAVQWLDWGDELQVHLADAPLARAYTRGWLSELRLTYVELATANAMASAGCLRLGGPAEPQGKGPRHTPDHCRGVRLVTTGVLIHQQDVGIFQIQDVAGDVGAPCG